MSRIDLHTHTSSSDGVLTSGELMALAAKKDLRAIAITDHDTVAGLEAGEQAAAEYGIEFVPGIEISALYNKKEVHLLGLFIDRTNDRLTDAIRNWLMSRRERNSEMLQRLADAGVYIDTERLMRVAGAAEAITRAHFARAIVDGGSCGSTGEAFEKYLQPGRPTYVARGAVSAADAIAVIRQANGIPILAHPLRYKLDLSQVGQLVKSMVADGLMGLECYYSGHRFHEQEQLKKMAEKNRLCISGGSDFHGGSHDGAGLGTGYGRLHVPYSVYSELKHFKQSLAFEDGSG